MFAAGGILAPTLIPVSVFGKNAPSNRITVGCIGCGRQMVSPIPSKRISSATMQHPPCSIFLSERNIASFNDNNKI